MSAPARTREDCYKDLAGAVYRARNRRGILYASALTIPHSALIGKGVGADALPRHLATVVAILGVVLLVQAIRSLVLANYANPERAAPGERSANVRKHMRAAGMLAIGIGYVLLLPRIGWLLSIFFLLLVVASYSGRRVNWRLFRFAAVVAVAFYLLFEKLLGITMPTGFWPDIWATFTSSL